MKKIITVIILFLWLFSFFSFIFFYPKGSSFVKSRASVLCLSCMGLEENEDF
ncbi:MAG: hypothetical protein ACK4Y7_05005 [Caldimicrobium sp.]